MGKSLRSNKKYNRPSLIIVLLIAAACLSFLANYYQDPFRNYRPWIAQPVSLQSLELQHNQDVEILIRQKMSLDISEKEKVILGGLHWLCGFMDKDANFDDVFTDLIILLKELSRGESRNHQTEVAQLLLDQSLARGAKRLPRLFSDDEESRWDFIGILPIIADSAGHREEYLAFFRRQFKTQQARAYQSGDTTFSQALQLEDVEAIGDYLIDTSFLHYYLMKSPNNGLNLPPNTFNQHIKAFQTYEYELGLSYDSDAFIDQAYLATHIPLVLTNYGEYDYTASLLGNKVRQFINETFEDVRYKTADLDLLAEYLQCLKILEDPSDERITESENFLIELQRSDGSWGTQSDFKGEPYLIFHPTWAVLTALNH